MASIYDWSTTAANNGTADSDTPWPEGMARRQVNDSARNMMKRNAELLGDIGGALSAGGTADGLTVTANSAFTAYANGQIVSFRATADNTGAATLSVNAIGAKAIRKMDSTGDVALAAGDIKNTGIYVAQYQTALNGAAGAWLLVNPTLSAAVYALSSLTTVDNTVPRFDGMAGKLQTSGISVDDTNNVTGIVNLNASGTVTLGHATASVIDRSNDTGQVQIRGGTSAVDGSVIVLFGDAHATDADDILFTSGAFSQVYRWDASAATHTFSGGPVNGAFNGTLGATTPASVSATTGVFSGNVIGNGTLSIAGTTTLFSGLTGTTGTFSGAVSMAGLTATTGSFSSSITLTDGTAGVIGHSANTAQIQVRGGSSATTGATLTLFGTSHATRANDYQLTVGSNAVRYQWDNSTGIHSWNGGGDTQVMSLDSSGALVCAGSGTFSGSASVGNDLTVTDDIFCGVTALINPAAAEYGMSVDAGGLLTISRNADLPLRVKRNGDGTLVAWYNGTTNVAVISQASDVVTYGAFVGAHWAQWAGAAPVDVLRGTVLETVDEMCAWNDTSNPEILPKVKVSDTFGSRRVYGVYSHPDSDGSGDFHVASLGAYVVRVIGPVGNGDLLESAGGGCARVQESEVFTSRTIAKVTSSAVVETYPDGSYLVPCTLHCG